MPFSECAVYDFAATCGKYGQELISYIRMTEDQRVLVVINLTGKEQTQEIAADPNYGEFTQSVYQSATDEISSFDGQTLTLAPYSMMILK